MQYQKAIEKPVQRALIATARILVEKLREKIDSQYYKDPEFYPNYYRRTFKFLDSASYQLIGKTMVEIFVDTDMMNYRNGFDADQVVEWAAQSKHGSENIETNTDDFFSEFDEYCEKNAIPIFKKELAKVGIKTI